MWIFGRHRHLSSRVLSEYLDGLLNPGERVRVSRALASCVPCQEELDGLQSVVSLLRGLEDLPIPRSFTLAAPPPVRAVARQPLPFRAPNWAYAGAASLAGLALALMVSADATGLLTREPLSLTSDQESVTITRAPEPTPASATTLGSADAVPTARPELAAAPQLEQYQAAGAPDDSAGREKGQTPPVAEPAQAPSTEQQAFALEATPAPEPTVPGDAGATGPAGDPGPQGPVAPASAPAPVGPSTDQAPRAAEETSPITMMSEAAPESEATEVDPTSEASEVSGLGFAEETRTPLVWRVLEGAAAAVAVLLLAVLVLKWRRSRRPTQ